MAKYTDADIERAAELVDQLHLSDDPAPAIAQLIADVREECAAIADEIATGPRRMPGEKAVAATIAKRIRGGGR